MAKVISRQELQWNPKFKTPLPKGKFTRVQNALDNDKFKGRKQFMALPGMALCRGKVISPWVCFVLLLRNCKTMGRPGYRGYEFVKITIWLLIFDQVGRRQRLLKFFSSTANSTSAMAQEGQWDLKLWKFCFYEVSILSMSQFFNSLEIFSKFTHRYWVHRKK